MVANIFGTDGIRGHCRITDINSAKLGNYYISLIIGAIIYSYPKIKFVLIASDTRETCPKIANLITHHCSKRQIKVVNLGVMPTSAVSCLTKLYKADLGIMISASHNPFSDNGIKLFNSDGMKISSSVEQKISESYYNLSRNFSDKLLSEHINIKKNIDDTETTNHDQVADYLNHILDKFNFNELSNDNGDSSSRKLKIVIDTANGSFSHIIDKAFSKLGHEIVIINNQPNGQNINFNCGSLYPKHVAKKVIEVSADFGICFDGDGDRVVLVSEDGRVIDGDNLIACLAVYLSEVGRLRGCLIVSQLANGALNDFLATKGIKVIREEVGDKKILARMIMEAANLGGEPSGHIILRDYLLASDGLLITLLLIEMLFFYDRKISDLSNCFQPNPSILFSHPIEDILTANLSTTINKIINHTKNIKDARFLIRKSGTENKLRILIESSSQKINQKYLHQIIELLKNES